MANTTDNEQLPFMSDSSQFNAVVDNLLTQSGAGSYEDSSDRRYKRQSALAELVKNSPEDDAAYPNGPDRGPVAAPISAPEAASILKDPAAPSIVKQGTVKAATGTIKNSQLSDEVANLMDDLAKTDASVRESYGKAAALGDERARLGKTKADLANEVASAQYQKSLGDARDKFDYITRAGVNTSDVNSDVNRAAVANSRMYNELLGVNEQLNSLEGVSFLDDPATWLLNQFQIPGVVKKQNILANTINTNKQYIDAQASTVELVKNANSGKMAAMTETEMLANAKGRTIDAQLEENKIKEAQLIRQGATDEKLAQMKKERIALMALREDREDAKDQRTLNYQESLRRAQEHEARMKALDAQSAEFKEAKLKQIQLQEERDAIVRERVGRYIPTANSEAGFKKLPKKLQDNLQSLLQGDSNALGADFAQVMEVAKIAGASVVAPTKEQQQVLGVAAESYKTAYNVLVNSGVKPEEAAKQAASQTEKQFMAKQSSTNDKGNPYSVPPLKVVAKILPPQNLVTQAVTQLGSANTSAISITHEMMMEKLADDVNAKKYTPTEVAKSVVEYASKALAASNEVAQFEKFALPKHTVLPANIDIGFFGGAKNVNLADPAAVTNAISILAARRRLEAQQIDQPTTLGN